MCVGSLYKSDGSLYSTPLLSFIPLCFSSPAAAILALSFLSHLAQVLLPFRLLSLSLLPFLFLQRPGAATISDPIYIAAVPACSFKDHSCTLQWKPRVTLDYLVHQSFLEVTLATHVRKGMR